MKPLHKRILDLSYKHNLSHLSSCLTAVDIIDEIYKKKKNSEPFVLSQGHAGLALYVVLEKHKGIDAEYLLKKHGVHPNYDPENGIYCSSGSLGCGIAISAGMALANRGRKVYTLISDGETMEGSVFETLRIKEEQKLWNLRVYLNANGTSAYDRVDLKRLFERLWAFDPSIEIRQTNVDQYRFLEPIDGHYYKLTKDDYENL